MALRLEIAERGGDQVLVADKLTVAVEERVLVRDFSSSVRRGDVIALVGPNGAGKSTLMATILGEREPAKGAVRIGGSIAVEYYRQDLDAGADGQDALRRASRISARSGTAGAIQDHLGCFGFSGDEVQWNTATLSGGERARVALALMMLRQANLLVLDEPTNHLDVESIEALEDAIEEYEGTVLLVSHDRALLRELATRVWAFEGDRLHDFTGPFVEWEAVSKERAGRARAEQTARDTVVRDKERAEREAPAESEERGSGGARDARRAVESSEAEVQQLEARVADLQGQVADPALYNGGADGARRAAKLGAELKRAVSDRDAALARWAEAVDRFESAGQGMKRR